MRFQVNLRYKHPIAGSPSGWHPKFRPGYWFFYLCRREFQKYFEIPSNVSSITLQFSSSKPRDLEEHGYALRWMEYGYPSKHCVEWQNKQGKWRPLPLTFMATQALMAKLTKYKVGWGQVFYVWVEYE